MKLTTIESMIAGAIAGSATVLCTNPIWVVNTRMTARKNEADEDGLPTDEKRARKPATKPSTIGTFLKIIQEEGPSTLFAGVLPALVLVVNPILQYTFFEQAKNMLEQRRRVTPKDAFYLGAIGKLLATSITYPYITVKARAHVAGNSGKKEGLTASMKRIIREEGYSGLYGGKFAAPYFLRDQDSFTDCCCRRYWTQGHAECIDCCIPLRLQGRPLRGHHQSSKNIG